MFQNTASTDKELGICPRRRLFYLFPTRQLCYGFYDLKLFKLRYCRIPFETRNDSLSKNLQNQLLSKTACEQYDASSVLSLNLNIILKGNYPHTSSVSQIRQSGIFPSLLLYTYIIKGHMSTYILPLWFKEQGNSVQCRRPGFNP